MKSIKNYLKSVGKQSIKMAKNNLKTKGLGSSKLNDSMSYKIVERNGDFTLEFYMSDYGRFLNDGVAGNNMKAKYYIDENGKKRKTSYKYTTKAPPVKVFEDWIKSKGIKGRNKKTGRFIKRKSLAFAMAKSRQIKGYNGLSFFTKPLSIQLRKVPMNLLQNIEQEFINTLNKI